MAHRAIKGNRIMTLTEYRQASKIKQAFYREYDYPRDHQSGFANGQYDKENNCLLAPQADLCTKGYIEGYNAGAYLAKPRKLIKGNRIMRTYTRKIDANQHTITCLSTGRKLVHFGYHGDNAWFDLAEPSWDLKPYPQRPRMEAEYGNVFLLVR